MQELHCSVTSYYVYMKCSSTVYTCVKTYVYLQQWELFH